MRVAWLLPSLLPLMGGCTFLVGDPLPEGPPSSGQPDLARPSHDMSMASCMNAQLATDPLNCGACGHDCTALPGVVGFLVGCNAGVCDIRGACQGGLQHCTARADDGCETDVTTPAHCGSCTQTCVGSKPFCAQDQFGNLVCAGSCGAITPNQCGNICVDELSDPNHCGSCTIVCPASAGATAICDNGFCSTQCAAGFHGCSGKCVDDSSVLHCATDCSPCTSPLNGFAVCDPTFGCDFECNTGFKKSGGTCAPIGDMALRPGDMAGIDLRPDNRPLCDCSGLVLTLGKFCPLTNICVGPDCCQENSQGIGTPCNVDPGCQPAAAGP